MIFTRKMHIAILRVFFLEVIKMYIRTIVEDTLDKNYQFLKNEHGLSLYINYNNKNIKSFIGFIRFVIREEIQ